MIRPSGSHEWYHCAGSQRMQQGLPPDDSDDTKEGIAAHWLAVQIITPYIKPNMELATEDKFVGTLAPNDVLIDAEMWQGVVDYITDVLAYCNSTGLLRSINVEKRIDIDTIFPGMKGTPDCWIYNPYDVELIIWDLKYGYGEVTAFENPALMNYAAGILVLLKVDGISDQELTVKMRIYQPRSYHSEGPMREWVVKASELRPYFNKLRTAAIKAMVGNDPCTPGNHCRHDKGRFRCESLQKTVYNVIDVSRGPVPVELKGNDLALEYRLLKHAYTLLEYRLNGIEAQVKSTILDGKQLPGSRILETYGRQRWKKNVDTKKVLMMCDVMGVDVRKPDNLDTPKQALTKFNKKAKELNLELDATVINQYTEIPFKGYKVIDDDGSHLREAFKKG